MVRQRVARHLLDLATSRPDASRTLTASVNQQDLANSVGSVREVVARVLAELLYDRAPMWGFALEIVYGVICWRVYRGSRSLLAMIVLGNLANLTLFSAAIPGPERQLAGRPLMIVTVILYR